MATITATIIIMDITTTAMVIMAISMPGRIGPGWSGIESRDFCMASRDEC